MDLRSKIRGISSIYGIMDGRYAPEMESAMGNTTVNRKIKGDGKDHPNALLGQPPNGRTGDAAARLSAVLDSHAQLCAAIRAAGRWMMRRAANKRDLQALDKVRRVLQEAEVVSGVGRRDTTDGFSDHEPETFEDKPKAKRIVASSSNHEARILVITNDPISRNRRESRRAL